MSSIVGTLRLLAWFSGAVQCSLSLNRGAMFPPSPLRLLFFPPLFLFLLLALIHLLRPATGPHLLLLFLHHLLFLTDLNPFLTLPFAHLLLSFSQLFPMAPLDDLHPVYLSCHCHHICKHLLYGCHNFLSCLHGKDWFLKEIQGVEVICLNLHCPPILLKEQTKFQNDRHTFVVIHKRASVQSR